MQKKYNETNYNEILIILKKDNNLGNISALEQIISSNGGKVLTRLPPRLVIALVDKDNSKSIMDLQSVFSIHSTMVTDPIKYDLDKTSLSFVNAWNMRKSKPFQDAKSKRSDENKPWDHHQKNNERKSSASEDHGLGLAECNIPVEDDTLSASSQERKAVTPTDTSLYMIGNVAIGIIIVDGPDNSATKFSERELNTVVAEVQEGTNILVGLSPFGANLSFVYDVHSIQLNVDPSSVTREMDWRNTAMSQLGYSPGNLGLYDYLQKLRNNTWGDFHIDWAYIAFVTKYAAQWFAYAQLGGPRLVMQYGNNGWGPDQIDRVFAHETGHIFHAPDEYSNSRCNTDEIYGYLKVPNCNCETNNPNSVDCIMKKNTENICQCSIGHFGWRDSDNDGILDPVAQN